MYSVFVQFIVINVNHVFYQITWMLEVVITSGLWKKFLMVDFDISNLLFMNQHFLFFNGDCEWDYVKFLYKIQIRLSVR